MRWYLSATVVSNRFFLLVKCIVWYKCNSLMLRKYSILIINIIEMDEVTSYYWCIVACYQGSLWTVCYRSKDATKLICNIERNVLFFLYNLFLSFQKIFDNLNLNKLLVNRKMIFIAVLQLLACFSCKRKIFQWWI